MIAIMNQKGGVGKTTTAFNLSYGLTMKNKKVTVLDMDPQGHLTTCFGLDMRSVPGIDAVLLDGAGIEEVMIEVRENLILVPSGPRLGEVEFMNKGGASRGMLLKNALADKMTGQDYVIMDCPPSIAMLGMNALIAADEVMMPVTGDYLALHGVSRLMSVFRHIEKGLRHNLKKWVVVTRYQERRRLAQEVRGKLLEYFPGQVLKTHIRENVTLAESPSFGKTVFEFKKGSNGAEDYLSLTDDLISRRVH